MTNKRKVLEGGGRVYMADIDVARGQEEKDKFAKQYGKVNFDLFIFVFEMFRQFFYLASSFMMMSLLF